MAFYGDGSQLVAGAGYELLRFDAGSGAVTSCVPVDLPAGAIQLAPDGRVAAAASWDVACQIRFYDLQNAGKWTDVDTDGCPDRVAFSRVGLVAFENGDRITVAELGSGARWAIDPASYEFLYTLVFSPDGSLLAMGHGDVSSVWKVPECAAVCGWRNDSEGIAALAISPGNERLVEAWLSRRTFVRAIGSGLSFCLHPMPEWQATSVAFSPEGDLLAVGYTEGSICLWDPRSGSLVRRLEGLTGQVRAVVFSSCGVKVTGTGAGLEIEWDAATGVVLRRATVEQEPNVFTRPVACSWDGALIATGGEREDSERGTPVRIQDAKTGEVIRSLWRARNPVDAVAFAFSLDGQILAAGDSDHGVYLWDVASGDFLKFLWTQSNFQKALAFSPDGRLLVAGGTWGEGPITRWSMPGRVELPDLEGHVGGVNSVAFSPDGRRLASGGEDGSVRLWDPVSGKLLVSLCLLPEGAENRPGDWIAYTPEGHYHGPPGVERYLAVAEGMSIHEDPARIAVLNRPDLVHTALE